MNAVIIDGRAKAAALREGLTAKVAGMDTKPGLAVILVGDDPASHVYVRGKQKACGEVGIKSHVYQLPSGATAGEVNATIDALNDNNDVHGILLQLPLPSHLNADDFLSRIDPRKDVDGLHPQNLGLLLAGRPDIIPCTPQGVMMLIRDHVANMRGAHAVVVGRSVLVGKPLAQLLLLADCTVTSTHSHTKNLSAITHQADILIAATGHPGLITGDMVKPGAIVIDVGIKRTEQGLKGDVDFASVSKVASALTPVPGGVGPMTVACLLGNAVRAATR